MTKITSLVIMACTFVTFVTGKPLLGLPVPPGLPVTPTPLIPGIAVGPTRPVTILAAQITSILGGALPTPTRLPTIPGLPTTPGQNDLTTISTR